MQVKTMTEGTPWKHILKFSIPVILGSLLQQLYNTVDAIIVGNFSSEDALSAVGTTGMVSFFFLAIAMGLSSGNGVIISQCYGAKDEAGVRRNASSGILFIMILGVISAVVGIVFARPLFKHLLSVPEEILGLTVLYFSVYAVGLIFQYGYNIFASILRALGDSKATLYFLIISSVANIILDYLFVALFTWGVAGAAVATDIAQLGSLIAAYIYTRKKYPVFRFKAKEYVWDSTVVRNTAKIGIPISMQLVVISVGFASIQKAVNEFGKVMTASYTVGNRIEQYITLPCNAFQTALATYTGQNIGAGKLDRVKTGAKQTLLISFITTVIISSIIWFNAARIAGLFGLGSEAMVYCLAHIKTCAILNIMPSMYTPLFGMYQGMGHSTVPAIVATCGMTVRVIATYVFRYSKLFGYTILWWNGIFGFALGSTITVIYYLSGKWQKNSQLQ